MAEKAGTSKAAAEAVSGRLHRHRDISLKKGDKVTLVGFGTFSVTPAEAPQGTQSADREGNEDRGGKAPKFKAGKALKEKVAK